MTQKPDVSDLLLTSAVVAWLDSQDWTYDLDISDDRTFSRIQTKVSIEDQAHRMYLESNETGGVLSLFVYSAVNIPPARMADAARLLNRINMRLMIGRLACQDDGDANPIQFLARIDVEGSSLVMKQVANMVGPAFATFLNYGHLFAALALTKQPADVLWDEFLKDEAEQEKAQNANDENDGPAEL